MRQINLATVMLITCTLLHSPTDAREMPILSLGEIGGGIFMPQGNDADVARISPVLQMTASVLFMRHLGLEAEFHYVPVLLKETVFPWAAHRKASQLVLVGGPRLSTADLLRQQRPLIAYLGTRAGFARISIRSDSAGYSGGWIGRPIDQIQNPGNGAGSIYKSSQKGLVLSPKAGAMLRLSSRAFLDAAFTPLFIFDRGDITTQFYFTLSYGLWSKSTL